MRKSVVIAATAAAFDLGVIAVSGSAIAKAPVSAKDYDGASTRQAGDRSNAPGACARGKHIPSSTVDACDRDPASIKLDGIKGERTIFIKIDATNTIQSCRARRGSVVSRDGAAQCQLPGGSDAPIR